MKWSQMDLPVEKPVRLTPAQRRRYARHLQIPEVGDKGQAKLLNSRVLLIGAGGLGSPRPTIWPQPVSALWGW